MATLGTWRPGRLPVRNRFRIRALAGGWGTRAPPVSIHPTGARVRAGARDLTLLRACSRPAHSKRALPMAIARSPGPNPAAWSDSSLHGLVDRLAAQLPSEPVRRNFERWPLWATSSNQRFVTLPPSKGSWKAEVRGPCAGADKGVTGGVQKRVDAEARQR